jgi:hypothetical protein
MGMERSRASCLCASYIASASLVWHLSANPSLALALTPLSRLGHPVIWTVRKSLIVAIITRIAVAPRRLRPTT